ALARLDRIPVNLQGIVTVLEFILPLQDFSRQLLRFAHGNKSGVQAIGESRAKDETAGFYTQHQVNVVADVVLGEGIDEAGEAELVFQQGGDVVKENPRLGEVGNLA